MARPGQSDGKFGSAGGTGVGSRDPKGDYDRWMSWCLKCGHGVHVGHGREWWGDTGEGGGGGGEGGDGGKDGGYRAGRRRKRICPVPECGCLCNEL